MKDGRIEFYFSLYSIYFGRYNFDFKRINYSTLTLKNKMDIDGHAFNNNDSEENRK